MTALPENLKDAIDSETQGLGSSKLAEASEDLSKRYRDKQNRPRTFMESDAHRCAYAVARMPATFAAVKRVMHEIQISMPEVSIESLLDLGAGPGTAMWAATEIYPRLTKITLVEQDTNLSAMGKRFAKRCDHPAVQGSSWQHIDLNHIEELERHDTIVLSYVIGELKKESIKSLVEKCWLSAKKFVVIIEPGTPAGFERIRAIRSQLIDLGVKITAPCPHEKACPMSGGDWCHFAERIERTSQHRQIKSGTKGHEDEKFSYVVASKMPFQHHGSRILRHPQKHSGHVTLELCTSDGLQKRTISRKEGDFYKEARKLEWGERT